jgi:large subunit ribosomal protein L23
MPVRDAEDKPRHFFREESKKYMTVEMETPFVWPEEPKDWKPWGKEDYKNQVKEMTRASGALTPAEKRSEQEGLRLQAKEILGWKRGKPAEKEKTGSGREKLADKEKKDFGKENGELKRMKHLQKKWAEKRSPRMFGRPGA